MKFKVNEVERETTALYLDIAFHEDEDKKHGALTVRTAKNADGDSLVAVGRTLSPEDIQDLEGAIERIRARAFESIEVKT